jgi:dipeptidase E
MNLGKRKLFLSSNSVYKDLKYLEHTVGEMVKFLGADVSRILFIPFAGVAEKENLDKRWTDYNEFPKKAFARFEIEVESLHTFDDKQQAVKDAEAIFIGGGNTHHLLSWLREFDLIGVIREEMLAGRPMMGSSAGTNIFCPKISTTNDMPIIENPTFDAINAIPFQINPHYLDPDPDSDHRGETREVRINEFLKVNDRKVLGLREGAWLRIEDGRILLEGLTGARLFARGTEPREFMPTPEGLDMTEVLLGK